MGYEVCPRGLEDRVPDRPSDEIYVTGVHGMDHGCRVAHVEDKVLDLDHLGKDLPGIGCGNHDIGHDDDYAEILSGVSAGQTVLYTATSSSSGSSWNMNSRGGSTMGGMPMMGF